MNKPIKALKIDRSRKHWVEETNEEYARLYDLEIDDNKQSLKYPVNVLKEKNLQFFDLKDITDISENWKRLFNERISTWIINLEKNVGKSYWLRNMCNELTQNAVRYNQGNYQKDEKFVLVFRSRENKQQLVSEINEDENYHYFIKGNKIFSKGYQEKDEDSDKPRLKWYDRGVLVGMALEYNTMHNSSSMQWEGVKYCFWDEYRSKIKLDREKSRVEFSKFLTMQSNIQRAKKDIIFILFGNNEPTADYIVEGFRIDKSTEYHINPARRIVYINIKAWEGLDDNDSLAKLNSDLDADFESFLLFNESAESKKALINRNYFLSHYKFWGYIVWDEGFYKIGIVNYEDKSIWAIEKVSKKEWERERQHSYNFAFMTTDLLIDPYITEGDGDFLYQLAIMYKYGLLAFWRVGDRNSFELLFHTLLPRIKFNENHEKLSAIKKI